MAIPRLIPGIPYGPLPRVASVSGALAMPPRLVVIHDTSNTASAEAEAHYAATRNDGQSLWTSCHAYVDEGGPLGSSPLDTVAWAAYRYANNNGWHVEMCGMNAGLTGAVPPVTVAHTARLVALLCDLAGIPKTKLTPAQVAAGERGICGHLDITVGLDVGDHDDPGPAFDWPAFIRLVQAGGDVIRDDRDAWIESARVEALTQGLEKVRYGETAGEAVWPVRTLKAIAADAQKAAEAAAQPAPVSVTDAQVAALGAQLEAGIAAQLAELIAAVQELSDRLAAAGRALEAPPA